MLEGSWARLIAINSGTKHSGVIHAFRLELTALGGTKLARAEETVLELSPPERQQRIPSTSPSTAPDCSRESKNWIEQGVYSAFQNQADNPRCLEMISAAVSFTPLTPHGYE